MKNYKVVKAIEENPDAMNLVNINDKNDIIMCGENEFFVGEIINEKKITLKECNYVCDDICGVQTGIFAFKN